MRGLNPKILVVWALLGCGLVSGDADHDWLVTMSDSAGAEVVDACWEWSDGGSTQQYCGLELRNNLIARR
jgi:hypothetical protein